MPDPSTTQPPLPSSQDMAATLARLQKTMEAIETPTGQAPAPMAPPAAPAAPGPAVGPAAPVVAPAPVGAPQAGTRPLANAGMALPAPAPRVIDLTQGGLAPQAPKPLERPGSIAAWGQETVAQPLQDKLAARTGDAALAGTPEVQQAVAQARAVQASTAQRIDDFLRARGYDEPVQLIGNGIDLPATIKKMEAAKLTKKAQAMGYGDWFQVPPGVDQARIREEVAQDVADDLRHAATVGRGAIFVNNDPAGSKEFLAQLPPPVAMAATTLLPRTTATFTPSGAEFRTESVVQPALRTVGAVSTIAAASGQAALSTGFFDEIQRGWEINDRAEQLEALGFEDDAAPVRADAEAVRNDAFRNALAAATGRTPEQVGDWKTWMFNLSDPEATRALVENVSRDPMLVQATDQMADDLIRIHGLEGKSATALRAALDTGGLLGDFFAPDPVTPTFAAFGAATRAGLRMAAETSDLADGAKYLREGLAAGQDLRTLIRDADQTYRGLGEALQIRIAAAARVNPDVVSNVRRLQSAAAKAEERVVKAQADLVLARGTAEEAIAARTAAEAQADAAKLQVELTTAHEQFADDVLAQWEAFGEGNLQRAERLQATAMEYKRDAKEAERALQQIDGANAPALTRVDALNKEVVAAQTAVQEAAVAAERAKRAYADLKAFRAEASKGRGFDVEMRRSPYVQTVEEVRKQQTLLVEEADAALQAARDAQSAELAQAADAVARARDRLKSARSAKAAKPELEQLRATVTQAEADLKRLRAGHRDAVELAQAGATQARKVRGIALADARARLKATTDEARASVRGGLADLDEEVAFQEQLYKEARQRQAAARDAAKAAAERHRQALQAAAPGFMEQQKAATRLLDLRTRAAELEQEAGWRILSVADEGKAADDALATGDGVLRQAGLMPDAPPPMGAKNLDDMLARGQMWGDALREAKAAARARAIEARRAYRETQRVLTGSDKAAQKAADKSLKELTDLAEAQYKNELAAARAAAWRKEVEGLADDIDRGLRARSNRPKLLTERTQNVLDGAIIDTAKDGTRTIDTAAFRAKMEKAYSPDAVGWWLRHAGDDKALWERSLGLNGTPQATLSPAEALRLQQGEVGLREGLKRTLPDAQAVAQTEALLALRKDPALRASSFLNTTPNELGRYYAAKWEAWKKTLDPMQAKLGDLDEKLILVSRIGDRKANLASDELLMVGRLAQAKPGLRGLVQWSRGGSREVIRDLGRYIDTTEPIPLFGRASIFNRGEFNESIIDRGRRQLLNDPAVVKPQEGEAAAEALGGTSHEEVVKIANRPMLGISRIWLPANVGINARQSGQLWKAAVQELERQTTFKGLLDAMERRTLGIVGSVDHIPDRPASYLARCLSQAAVQADIADVMVRELGGILKAEEAADVNRILTYDWDRIQSPQAAWEGLARMGQPFTQTATRTSREAVAQQQALVRIATTRGGEDVVAMASQARALDDTLDKVVKETHAHYSAARTPQEALALKHSLDLQAFWKSSVTIGLVVPNPRYFINNIFGNISQIWLTQGLGTATRTVGQSLFHNLPFVGPLMERALDQAATRVGDVPFLGSMVEALWNPNVTKILGGQKGAFTAANGIVYDLETVGRWASEDGVFTSFMQEEYGRLFRRARGQGPLTRLRYLQDDIFAWANEIEVRQRTALYVDLLRQGYSRSAARERTLRALYDWEGALGGAEAAVMTTLIPFYRFMKLGFRQAWYEAVAKPLIHPEIATLEALTGSSGLARMRNQAELLRLPELADDGDYQTEADKFDAMARYRNLDYLNKRIQWTERNDPERIAMYQGTRSQFAPYSTVNLPALTAIDMGNLVTLSLYALPAVALAASGSDLVPPDASQPFWDEATNLVGPLAAPLLGQFAQISGADSQTTREVVRLKPGEAATAQMLGLGVGWGLDRVGAHDLAQTAREKLDFTNVGPDYQGTYGTAFTKMMVTSMPGLLQFPQWYDALYGENPVVRAAQEKGQVDLSDVVPYFTWASTQLTGVMRRTPFNPDDVLTRHQDKLRDELNRVAEKETGPLRERQAVKP